MVLSLVHCSTGCWDPDLLQGPQTAGLLPDMQMGVAPPRSVQGLLSGAGRGPGPWLRGAGTEPEGCFWFYSQN